MNISEIVERLTKKDFSFSTNRNIYEEYEYETYTDGVKTYTSSLVSTLTLNAGNTTAQYSYTYDSLGNITEIRKNGTTVSRYEYDALNQLVREDDCAAGTATIFTYDKAGNITAKYVFPWVNSPSSILMGNVAGPEDADSNYTYSSSAWGDLLTGYNGTTINYDSIGNPTNWRNARILAWNGKQLTTFSRDMTNHALSFSYNADGIRTSKSNSDYIGGQRINDTHDYILDGTNIVRELITHTVGTGSSATTTTKTLYYLYDASGSVVGLIYNSSPYYFQKNIQGDIIRICNAGGDTVVEYTYDAWGKVLSVTGTMASTLGQDNPFRYRGYYYDTETGFYYLQTRYYDPEVGRFLNADAIIGANGGILGYNSFAYCSNNPVVGFDPSGEQYDPSREENDNYVEYIAQCAMIGDYFNTRRPTDFLFCEDYFIEAVRRVLARYDRSKVDNDYYALYLYLIGETYNSGFIIFSFGLFEIGIGIIDDYSGRRVAMSVGANNVDSVGSLTRIGVSVKISATKVHSANVKYKASGRSIENSSSFSCDRIGIQYGTILGNGFHTSSVSASFMLYSGNVASKKGFSTSYGASISYVFPLY